MTISIIDLSELESERLRQLVHSLQQQITLALDESVELRLTNVKSVLIGRLSMCLTENRNPTCTPSPAGCRSRRGSWLAEDRGQRQWRWDWGVWRVAFAMCQRIRPVFKLCLALRRRREITAFARGDHGQCGDRVRLRFFARTRTAKRLVLVRLADVSLHKNF